MQYYWYLLRLRLYSRPAKIFFLEDDFYKANCIQQTIYLLNEEHPNYRIGFGITQRKCSKIPRPRNKQNINQEPILPISRSCENNIQWVQNETTRNTCTCS